MIIVVLSFKGGVSKTITAIHVAELLSQHPGRKVVLGGDCKVVCVKGSEV